jgi:UDP-galactopyranose mutase
MKFDHLVVGAGFAGSVMAERLASAGRKVLVIDRRPHVAGNAFDELDEHGLIVHKYGPHIFHTNAARIVEYLGRFTAWRHYEHRVLAVVDGRMLPIPINRTTVNRLYGLDLDETGVAQFLERARTPREPVRTSEDVVLNTVGVDLYEKFFKNYTQKQWGIPASELNASVAARIPVRFNDDDRYFTDEYQVMPKHGYTSMFERMLDHPNITVETGVDFDRRRPPAKYEHLVYTGPIDSYFDCRLGKLPYRSLRFEHQHLADVNQFQPVGTVNYPNDHAFTRITEFKHLTGQAHAGTSIVREYPEAEGDPYYPVPRPENQALFRRYETLAAAESNTTFVGRLAQYKYYNMDQVVGAAMTAARDLIDGRRAVEAEHGSPVIGTRARTNVESGKDSAVASASA